MLIRKGHSMTWNEGPFKCICLSVSIWRVGIDQITEQNNACESMTAVDNRDRNWCLCKPLICHWNLLKRFDKVRNGGKYLHTTFTAFCFCQQLMTSFDHSIQQYSDTSEKVRKSWHVMSTLSPFIAQQLLYAEFPKTLPSGLKVITMFCVCLGKERCYFYALCEQVDFSASPDQKCLQRGTSWLFKWCQVNFHLWAG